MSGIRWTVSPLKLGIIYLVWITVVLTLTINGYFTLEKDPTPGFALTFFIFTPPILFLLYYWKSPAFKEFIHSIDGRMVTWIQSCRYAGPTFYLGYMLGAYPAVFGIPATVLDLAWGVSAPLAVYWWNKKPFPKALFVGWHIAGIVELMVLAALRIMTLPTPLGILLEDVTSEGLNQLPWSFFPSFAAPNLIFLHLIGAIQGLRRGRE